MDFTTRQFPSPGEVKRKLPLPQKSLEFIEKSRQEAIKICDLTSPKKALIIGPCSIHEKASAIEYAKNCIALQKEVEEKFFIVMRVYCEKPRTGINWKGFIYDPHLDESNNIEEGIFLTRSLLLELADLSIPCATEFLDPLIAPYIEDLITWGFIGARTVKSQIHRQFISKFSFPIGVKNSLDGDLLPSIKATLFANHPQTFLTINDHGAISLTRTNGNPYVHPVLRGANDKPNYDEKSLVAAGELLKKFHLPEGLLVDCSHGNSQNDFTRQKEIFFSLIDQIHAKREIIGMMVESHLHEGSQSLCSSHLQYGVSITDPCISWETTYQMIKEAFTRL